MSDEVKKTFIKASHRGLSQSTIDLTETRHDPESGRALGPDISLLLFYWRVSTSSLWTVRIVASFMLWSLTNH